MVEGGGWLEYGNGFCLSGQRGSSGKPGPCSLKWSDRCLASPGLSVRYRGGEVGCCFPLLSSWVRSDVASPELSVGDVSERAVHIFLFALGLALMTSWSFMPSPELSFGEVDRAVEVRVRRSPGLCVRVVRVKAQGSYPLVIFLVPSPDLSVRDVGKAAG